MSRPHSPGSPWRIGLVEDHLLQRKFTERIIDDDPDLRVVYSGETLPDFAHWWDRCDRATRPNLLLLDLMVDHRAHARPTTVARLVGEELTVGLFSALSSPSLVRQMLRAGVCGVIGKRDPVADLLHAVHSMLLGKRWITPEFADMIARDPVRPRLSEQEERTLLLYVSGLTLDAVAASIGVRPDTAKKYLQRVKAKYHAAGRAAGTKLELREAALQDGFFPDPTSRYL